MRLYQRRQNPVSLKDRARGQTLKNAFSRGRPEAACERASTKIDLQPAALMPARADVQRSAMVSLVAKGADLRNLPATCGQCRKRADSRQRAGQQPWRTRERAPALAGASPQPTTFIDVGPTSHGPPPAGVQRSGMFRLEATCETPGATTVQFALSQRPTGIDGNAVSSCRPTCSL